MLKHFGRSSARLVILLSPIHASALTFSPLVAKFAPEGAGASRAFSAGNTGSAPVRVTIAAFERKIDVNGRESLVSTDDFALSPATFELAANATREVAAKYKGPTPLPRERAYRFVVEQNPAASASERASDDAGEVHLVVRYNTAIYVTPPGATPTVQITNVRALANRRLELTLVNSGGAHQLLHPAWITIAPSGSSSSPSVVLGGNTLKVLEKQNLLAGTTRTLVVPRPRALKGQAWSATIRFGEEPK